MAPLTEREREALRLGTASAWARAHARGDRTTAVDYTRAGPADRGEGRRQDARGTQPGSRRGWLPTLRSSGLQIDVDTRDRIVTLTGAVNRNTKKARAVELASNIEKVIRDRG